MEATNPFSEKGWNRRGDGFDAGGGAPMFRSDNRKVQIVADCDCSRFENNPSPSQRDIKGKKSLGIEVDCENNIDSYRRNDPPTPKSPLNGAWNSNSLGDHSEDAEDHWPDESSSPSSPRHISVQIENTTHSSPVDNRRKGSRRRTSRTKMLEEFHPGGSANLFDSSLYSSRRVSHFLSYR